MITTHTHTYAILEIDPEAFEAIKQKLTEAGYGHAFMPGGEIDMAGIALAPDKKSIFEAAAKARALHARTIEMEEATLP